MRTLIALLMALLLTGCGAASAPVSPIDAKESGTAATNMVETAEKAERIHYTVSLETSQETVQAETGEELATYRFSLPVLSAQRADGSEILEAVNAEEEHALSVISVFNEKFGNWAEAESFPEVVSWAEADFAWNQSQKMKWVHPYTLELDCSIYQTDRMISVSGIYYNYTGGAHPNTWMLGWNFDLNEGVFFGGEFLADDTRMQEAVSAEIIRQAKMPREDGFVPVESYWEGYEAIIANWGNCAVSFDETGMLVVFSHYELAPYAFGSQEFHISYEQLQPYLNDYGLKLLGIE